MQNIIFLIIIILIGIILILIFVRIVIYLTNIDEQQLNNNERELSESIAKFTERCQAGKNVSDFKGVQFKGNRPPQRERVIIDTNKTEKKL